MNPYHIPANYTDAGRLLGLFEIRQAIEAAAQEMLISSFVRTCIGFASSTDEYELISTDRKAIAARYEN